MVAQLGVHHAELRADGATEMGLHGFYQRQHVVTRCARRRREVHTEISTMAGLIERRRSDAMAEADAWQEVGGIGVIVHGLRVDDMQVCNHLAGHQSAQVQRTRFAVEKFLGIFRKHGSRLHAHVIAAQDIVVEQVQVSADRAETCRDPRQHPRPCRWVERRVVEARTEAQQLFVLVHGTSSRAKLASQRDTCGAAMAERGASLGNRD